MSDDRTFRARDSRKCCLRLSLHSTNLLLIPVMILSLSSVQSSYSGSDSYSGFDNGADSDSKEWGYSSTTSSKSEAEVDEFAQCNGCPHWPKKMTGVVEKVKKGKVGRADVTKAVRDAVTVAEKVEWVEH
mmetsp:Transcript_27916/g.82016  ORF Transcript_27916/g.82016 Transcript_27916/m.82016 type:complete len:130 (-) Transcript_27916:639-1028(-)